jgi:hypothetical protein
MRAAVAAFAIATLAASTTYAASLSKAEKTAAQRVIESCDGIEKLSVQDIVDLAPICGDAAKAWPENSKNGFWARMVAFAVADIKLTVAMNRVIRSESDRASVKKAAIDIGKQVRELKGKVK